MRHHNKNKKFGRQRGERDALLHGLTVSLIEHGKITTTESRAKALRPRIEKMITKARNADIAAVRMLRARLGNNRAITDRLVKEVAPKYKGVAGGYTRITKLGARSHSGDAAEMAMIELI